MELVGTWSLVKLLVMDVMVLDSGSVKYQKNKKMSPSLFYVFFFSRMSGLTSDALNKLQLFLGAVKKNPDLFYLPELKFFKEFVENFGGTIPPRSSAASDTPKPEKPTETPKPSAPEEESEESDLELDNTGVVEGEEL